MYEDYYGDYPGKRKSPMAIAAIGLGIVSILSCSLFYVSLPCGAVAIICAILSRSTPPMPGIAKAGLICGLVGIVSSIFLTVSAFVYVLTDDAARAYLERYYQIYTGDYEFDLDEWLSDFLPRSETVPEYTLPQEGGNFI